MWDKYLDSLGITSDITQSFYKLDKEYANNPQIIAKYADKLRRLNRISEAEQIVRKALKKNYHIDLIKVYGDINHNNQQLNFAHTLLDKNKHDHNLYITLAKLTLRQNLYDKACEYLDLSLKIKQNDEAHTLLSNLILIKLDNKNKALESLNNISFIN